MADDNTTDNNITDLKAQKLTVTSKSLLAQIEGESNKTRADQAKTKLKEIMKKKKDAQKIVDSLQAELDALAAKFDSGEDI